MTGFEGISAGVRYQTTDPPLPNATVRSVKAVWIEYSSAACDVIVSG